MADPVVPALDDVRAIAERAGDAALELYRSQGAWVEKKADGSPLTQADMASEQVIRSGLGQLDPATPYLSEESTRSSYAERKEWTRFWLVDPLDGTKEFIKRTDEFTINIALIDSGEPVLGVIVAPAFGVTYYAARGQGAWKQHHGGPVTAISSTLANPAGPVRIVESVSHPSPGIEQFLDDFDVTERIKIGSSLKFCLLAEDAADVYPRLGPTMEWDVAAGDCIFRYSARSEEAPHPSPLSYNKESLRNDRFVLGLPPGTYTLPPRSS